jgi:predicted carbohydrate-binding protein with CBM5 and CBM33 domain
MRRKLALTLAAATTFAGTAFLPVSPADAHGGLTYPATRTYACYVDGLAGGGGDLNPTNPACIAAIAQGGKQPLWDWFGNLLPNVGDQHRQTIPDGRLCGPGDAYEAYNLPRTDWPTTDLTPGETVTFRYNAWAPHPGTWSQYVTRDGWDPTKPLGWGDLEPAPFDEVTNPPINGSGPHGAEYTWRATLPSGKQGRHIIFSIWERSDSPEAFYNCSDVDFGGSGGSPRPTSPTTTTTTTPPPTTTTTQPPAPTPPTTQPQATTPPTTQPPAPTPPTTQPPAPTPTPSGGPAACEVAVDIVTSWPGGYLANLKVTNSGGVNVSGWDVEMALGGSSVGHLWGGTHAVEASRLRIAPEPWNANLTPGAEAHAGFVGNGTAPTDARGTCVPHSADGHHH